MLTDLNEGNDLSEQGNGAEAAKVRGEWCAGPCTLSYWDIFRCGAAGIRELAEAFLGRAGGMSLLVLLLLSSNRPPAEIWVNVIKLFSLFCL